MKTASMVLVLAAALICIVAATGYGHASTAPHSPARPSPSPRPSPSALEPLSANEILERTEDAVRGNPDPPYIYYKMHEVFVHHGRHYEFDYQIWYRSDGKGLMQNVVPNRNGTYETFFGYPFPSAPDNNILLYATPAPVTTPPPPVGSPLPGSSAPLIASQTVRGDRYYDVALAGIESYEGHEVYHLTLRPIADPQRHPWTDLWVDTHSYEVWRAHADATGRAGPLVGRAVADVEFAPIGNYWLVQQASADAQGHIAIFSDSGHYEYYFSDFGFPNTLPDWYFDQNAYGQHHS
jgi:hypothetical protein